MPISTRLFRTTTCAGDIRRSWPSKRFDPIRTRETLRSRGKLAANVVRYAYRPFDLRCVYLEPETKLLDEKRSEYWPHVFAGNIALSTQQKPRGEWQSSQVVQSIACLDLIDRGSSNFPLALNEAGTNAKRPNLSQSVQTFLTARALPPLFRHIVATLHAPSYRTENAGALLMDWPRVPLPADADTLRASADLGATLATLLDPETPAPGVSTGALRPGLRSLGLPAKRDGKTLETADMALTADWGSTQNAGSGSIRVMPGRGLTAERDYTAKERAAIEADGKALGLTLDAVFGLLGAHTLDVHLNAAAFWTNVPPRVWDYTLGGYQVIKKWLTYREQSVLGRALKPDEAAYVSEMIRRIAATLLMGPALDANYAAAKANAVEWKER